MAERLIPQARVFFSKWTKTQIEGSMHQKKREIKGEIGKGSKWFPYDLRINSKYHLEASLESIPVPAAQILTYLITSNYHTFYWSQNTIAQQLGMCRATVNRYLKFLVRSGIISKTYYHRRTCTYSFTSHFQKEWVKETVKKVLKIYQFFALPIQLLISATTALFQSSVTPLYLKRKNYIKKSITFEVRRSRSVVKIDPPPKIKLTPEEKKQNLYQEIISIDNEITKFQQEIQKSNERFCNFDPWIVQSMLNFAHSRVLKLEKELQEAMSKLAVFENPLVEGT